MQVITTHLHADFDAMAAMVAAGKLYPDAVLVFSGSQEKNLRDFIAQAVYQYDFKRCREIRLDEVTELILVDTRQSSRIGNFAKCLENPGIALHIYDHHPDMPGDLHGEIEVIRPVGSSATIFVQLFQEQGITLSSDEATLLALGIYEDTGSFAFPSTTPEDLIAAAWLVQQGADLQMASQFISHELTSEHIGLLHTLIKSATTYTIQGIDIVVAKLSLPHYVDEFAMLVRRFMDMENLDTLFALAEMKDRIHFIARSRIPEVNVGEIAREFGGGGHASAASATVRQMTLIQAEDKLIHVLHKHVKPESMAADLMSSPVISVGPDIAIQEANQFLTRYNITVLPVLRDKTILGMISRRVVEKAIFHGLGDSPVSDYMTTEVVTLPSTATLADIQEVIIHHRQRLLPVVDAGRVQGVITRTDLLNLLINDPGHLPTNLLNPEERPSTERHRNLTNLLVERLSKKMMLLLRTIGEVAEAHGSTVYAVGGFVRDLLLRVTNLDLDVVVEDDGILFAKRLADKLGGTVRTHQKFNTAVVKLPDGFKLDVATARLEYYEYPAAMPTVELSSLKLDLYRRDFTINAMALHLNPDHFGILVDFFNCQNDVKERRIRILHNLSFVEDPTRIFRAIRFEQRMGFRIGEHTEKLIRSAVKMDLFGRLFGRRFFVELRLILSEEDPVPALRRLAAFGLFGYLRAGLLFDQRLERLLIEAHRAVAWHKLLYLDEPCHHWMVYLLVLMIRASNKVVAGFCARFEVPERYRAMLVKEKEMVERSARVLNRAGMLLPSEIYLLLQGMGHEGLLCLMAVVRRKAAQKMVSQYVTQLRHVSPVIRGADLQAMGYRAGPIYRTILTHLLEAKLDGVVANRADEIAFIQQHYPLTDGEKT